jgi:DNA polymerase V
MRSVALIDVNNFYISCERVFNLKLKDKPVEMLSNNDGCADARSQEAKDLGIKVGQPWFQFRDLVRKHDVRICSSNYTLQLYIMACVKSTGEARITRKLG